MRIKKSPYRNKILKYIARSMQNQLLAGIEFAEYLATHPYKKRLAKDEFKSVSSFYRSLKNLIEKDLIVEKDDQFYLTLKGQLELLRKSKGKYKFKYPKWDGIWRIVSFDIPESKRNNRNLLRDYLNCLGFRFLQKSLWITPYKIKFKDLVGLIDEEYAEKIFFIETKKISQESKIKKMFDLK